MRLANCARMGPFSQVLPSPGATSAHRIVICVVERSFKTGLFFGEGGVADNIVGALPVVPILWSLRRLFEISQIGRRLILLGGHQESIPVQEIVIGGSRELRDRV